jgi:hypothetical protein
MENNADNKDFHPEASLKIIYEMIESAKSKIGSNYFYYLFWGYLVAVTCLIEFVLITLVKYSGHYLVWPVLMAAGALVTVLFYVREKKTHSSKSFIGTTMSYLWLGWAVCFCILLLFLNLRHDYTLILPMIMAMYGLAVFISGGVVNFKPLIFGAVIAWIASVVAFFVTYPVQLIIMVGVVLAIDIIPGHLLKNKSKA